MTSASASARASARESTRRTVLIAGAANLLVGLAKLVAGIISGSSAMLAEAAHSAADTLDQVFLLTSVHQGERPADRGHPFGYGQDRYFWSLLAAFGIFIAGAGFSVIEGILALGGGGEGNPIAAYVALGVAFAAEGTSFARAYLQVRGEARRRGRELFEQMEASADTTVKTALFEDSAAMAGLVFATVGVVLSHLTRSAVWDAGASFAIGALLAAVAVKLGLDSRDLLIGRAADPGQQRTIRAEIENTPGVATLLELRTMHLGPDALIVAVRVDLNDEISADQVEDLADDIDHRLASKLPVVPHVFIDPTRTVVVPQDPQRR